MAPACPDDLAPLRDALALLTLAQLDAAGNREARAELEAMAALPERR